MFQGMKNSNIQFTAFKKWSPEDVADIINLHGGYKIGFQDSFGARIKKQNYASWSPWKFCNIT